MLSPPIGPDHNEQFACKGSSFQGLGSQNPLPLLPAVGGRRRPGQAAREKWAPSRASRPLQPAPLPHPLARLCCGGIIVLSPAELSPGAHESSPPCWLGRGRCSVRGWGLCTQRGACLT